MPDKNDEDITAIVALGIIAAAGYGIYKAFKSTKPHIAEEPVETTRSRKIISETYTTPTYTSSLSSDSDNDKKYAECPVCGRFTEQCQYEYHGQYGNSKSETRCMECNGGEGNYPHECYECWWWQNDND